MSTLLNFVRMFVRAHEENCKQLELEKKKAQKEAENEKQLELEKKKTQKEAGNEKLKNSTATKVSEHLIQSPIKSASIQ